LKENTYVRLTFILINKVAVLLKNDQSYDKTI